MTRSTWAINSRLASGSLRFSGAMLTNSTSGMASKRSRIKSPVVPASPSMNIFLAIQGSPKKKFCRVMSM